MSNPFSNSAENCRPFSEKDLDALTRQIAAPFGQQPRIIVSPAIWKHYDGNVDAIRAAYDRGELFRED